MYNNNKNHKKWTITIETIFKLLKDKITKQPILVLPYFHNLFQVSCDVSGMEIGTILGHDDKPITYFNEELNV